MATAERPPNIEGEDFSNYFSAYGYLYNQKEMLEDPDRMSAYFRAITGNTASFKDKVVLDVGTGSGILAIWAAKAGAKKVYAVEATYMAKHAQTLCEANGVGHIVEVIQSAMEDVELPEKVDIIVSEWMGYMLLRESMLDSVLIARDKYLAPGGAMYPSHATMYMAPIFDYTQDRRDQEYRVSLENWAQFSKDLSDKYQVSFDCLSESYNQESRQYFYDSALWVNTHPSQLLGPPVAMLTYDLHTLTLDELKATQKGDLSMAIMNTSNNPEINGFVIWFDAYFKGSEASPAMLPVTLSTAPNPEGATHWGQQQFHLAPGIKANHGDSIKNKWEIRRQKQNPRLLEVTFSMTHINHNGTTVAERVNHYRVD
eukprot:m.173908 g.173908  ORF g.173908 m.173908 type:complete len:370 (+) comp15397_c0_seq9:134-1243(+)